ncbi:hypothetical protein ACHWQZ_G013070 [Mnemiopsis leidyi]
MKIKAATEIGIEAQHIKLGGQSTQPEVISALESLNNDPEVHGIILQLPLDTSCTVDEDLCTNTILPSKDVDGLLIRLTELSSARLTRGVLDSSHTPCTPKGCLRLIKSTGVKLEGSKAVVIGRSKIVGSPMRDLLLAENCTVTTCHSRTVDLSAETRTADILVVGAGKARLVTGDMVKPGAVVIDCGINYGEEKNGKRELIGDVDYASVSKVAGFITPVPGGVGPMTVAMLMENTVKCAEKQTAVSNSWDLSYLPLKRINPVPSDSEIALAQTPNKIRNIARGIGIPEDKLELYGDYKAKIKLELLDSRQSTKQGNYVLVCGITPTPLGEGKSTTTIGLSQSLSAHLNKQTIACIRQPSMGPTFGIKGGAAGGGYSQVMPMDEFNMHLTGDIHAIATAHNLVAAALDTRIFHEATQSDEALFKRLCPPEKPLPPIMLRRLQKLGIAGKTPEELSPEERVRFARLNIDPTTIMWNRVLDMNDRFLRKVTVGQSATEKGMVRETKWDITVASEIMAVLALATDLSDLKSRIGRIVVANSVDNVPVTVDDLGVTGACTALMREALKPTLMQTLEGSPVLVHAGPFANIAHGNSSIIADRMALKLVGSEGYVCTEAGFGADIGGEKFFDIKCRYSGLKPSAAVLVCTVRALKMHGGGPKVTPGGGLAPEYKEENLTLLCEGLCHLTKQIANVTQFGTPCVVAVNRFHTDTDKELEMVREHALKNGAFDAQIAENWEKGGEGAMELARAVVKACKSPSNFKFLYDLEQPLISKMNIIVQKIYGGEEVVVPEEIAEKISNLEKQGYGGLPICMAKTHLSLSCDVTKKGVPTDFKVPIQDVRLSAGAGFVYPLAGTISTMPGLPTRPAFYNIDVDTDTGDITGLF